MGRTQVDEVFEQCLAAMQTQGLTVEDCLQLHPALREELEPLLSLAARLQTARSVRPAAEFRAATAQRLSNLAAARSAPPRPRTGFRGFWTGGRAQPRMRLNPLLVGVLVVALIASGFGTVAASAQSLPGDLLYPVKRAEEAVHFALTPDEAGRAGLRLDYASRRIDEAVTLVQENRTQALDQVLADYNDQIQSELTFLQPGSPLTADQQLVLAGRLLSESQRQADGLDLINRAAPPAVQATIETALSSSQQARNQAAKILQDSDSTQSIQPTPSAAKPTLSPTPQNSPTQRPSLSTPVPASSPSSLLPQATPSDGGALPTKDVVLTPPPTPGTSNSDTRVATLPAALTAGPTLSPTPQNSPTLKPSLSTPAPATPSSSLLPQATQPNSSPLPTKDVVIPPPPAPGSGNSTTQPPVSILPAPTKSK